ncbi:MAG: hypothetical protein MJ233_04755 [Mycoplasmoidaceae bacterium]|nr:hypothetical protein [Mycoplasmoidaceae bacterium]
MYSLDTAVFQPGDDGEYEPGHYYYLDDFSDSVLLGVTQQKFGPDSSISS